MLASLLQVSGCGERPQKIGDARLECLLNEGAPRPLPFSLPLTPALKVSVSVEQIFNMGKKCKAFQEQDRRIDRAPRG